MARRVDIPRGKVFVGHDVVIGIPVVNEVSKLPQEMTGWGLEMIVRDTPESGTILLTKTGADISKANHHGIDDLALISLFDTDTWNGTTIIFSGRKSYGALMWAQRSC